ncbi:hypothetical protein B0H14DRAFT_2583817 [Mycena olivaceomarginata]|nr:hypothetical protein B0H14DRAFT_2583817 [Mycena olivaceomarginata]
MIDFAYLVLILCLVATNFSRLWAFLRWLVHLFPVRRNPDLVPYFDRHGRLIGMVRITPRNIRGQSTQNNGPTSSRRRADTLPARAPTTISTPVTWDGWPDGRFQCSFSPQNVVDTDQLETNWACEALKGRRGSAAAPTWQKGKEIPRRCLGILECTSRTAPRNVSLRRETATPSINTIFGWLYHISGKRVPHAPESRPAVERAHALANPSKRLSDHSRDDRGTIAQRLEHNDEKTKGVKRENTADEWLRGYAKS